jgi:DNA-binding transcriptional MerR regulator
MHLDAGPSRKIFYKIGEVSDMTQLPSYVLRFWESQFGFLKPKKSRGQQRLYLQRDIETVLEIKRMLYDEGYTIAGLKRYWSRRGRRAGKQINPREVTERLRGNLQAILRILDSYKVKT